MATSTTDTGSFFSTTSITGPPALTTIFTPPAWCSTESDALAMSKSCLPSSLYEYYNEGEFFSPGICPYGYTAACTLLLNQDVMTPYVDIEGGESAAYCCPSGYGCDQYYSYDAWCQTSTSFAMALQIRWRESDLPYLESKPTIPATASYNTDTHMYSGYDDTTTYQEGPTNLTKNPNLYTATETVTATPTMTAVATKIVQAQGMSKGAKIGISVAVPVAFLGFAAAALAGCLLLWRRHKSKKFKSQGSSDSNLPRGQSTRSAQYATMEQSFQMTQSPGEIDEYPSPLSQSQGQTPLFSPADFDPRLLTASPSPPPANENIGIARTIGIASPTHSGHARVSSLPEVVRRPNDDEEVRQIQLERARLQEKRSRLFQMNQLDQEEERLRQRLESRITAIGAQPSNL